MPRLRSIIKDAVRRGVVHTGLGNFAVPSLSTVAGRLAADVFAAFNIRVTLWRATISGTIENSTSFFSTVSTLSGFTDFPVTTTATEKNFAYGEEDYGIRTGNGANSTWDCSTALTMLGAGVGQQPFAPAVLDNVAKAWTGPHLSALDVVNDVGAAEFELTGLCESSASTNGDGSPSYPRVYAVQFRLQTSPEGYPLDVGETDPVEVGQIIARIPKWFGTSGNNDLSIPLYCDYAGNGLVWLAVDNNGGGGLDYSGDNGGMTGDVTITMTPIECYGYEDNGERAWNDDCTPAIPLDKLLRWLP